MAKGKSVDQSARENLKGEISKVGNRALIAAAIGMPYNTLNHKLNNYLPLSQAEYDRILAACQKIGGQS